MTKYNIILIGAIILIIVACKKDPVATCPSQNHFTLSNLVKQFAFRKNSYWVLKNSTTGVTDTLKVFFSSGILSDVRSGTSKECQNGDIYDEYDEFLEHKMFLTGAEEIDLYGNVNGITTNYHKYCSCGQLSFYEKNTGDSILFNNNTNWSKIENIYPTITINGNTYNNVYQMFYYPDLYGFKRIWWCPTIGFVKFEHFNLTSSLSEFWELANYNVQLY